MSIALTRIDDRLIHGQVVMTWIQHIKCTQIKIIDDKTANDEFMCKLLTSTAPNGIALEILTIKKAIPVYSQWDSSKENVMIIVRTPLTLAEMVNSGIVFKSINVGGIAIGPGRKQFHKNIALTAEEKLFLLEQFNKGVEIFYQMITTERREPLTEKMFR